LVDLKGSDQTLLDPLMKGKVADIFTHEFDAPLGGFEHTSEQMHQGGFASAIGSDQRVSLASVQTQMDMIGGSDAAKGFDQTLTHQHILGTHGLRPQVQGRHNASRPTEVNNTKNKPNQNIQY